MNKVLISLIFCSQAVLADGVASRVADFFGFEAFQSKEQKQMSARLERLKQTSSAFQVFQNGSADQMLDVLTVFSYFIPEKANVCAENPLTFECDEAVDTDQLSSIFQSRFPEDTRLDQVKAIEEEYLNYRTQHEMKKLEEALLQYNGAVHPKGLDSRLIRDLIWGDRKRTDGMVHANCVGPRGTVDFYISGKCDLVKKHALLARVLNEAFSMESFVRDQNVLRDVRQVVVRYLSELKEMVDQDRIPRSELFPTYREMNFDEVIQKYQRLIQ